MSNYQELIDHWKSFKTNQKHLIHKDDQDLLKKYIFTFHSLEAFANSDNYFSNKKLIHSGLMPQPFCGDIKRALIYLLLENPGFTPMNYFEKDQNQYYKILKRNLKQQKCLNNFSFFPLDPALCWTGSARWWHKKLAPLIERIMSTRNINYLGACRFLANKICALELFPYHSQQFGIHRSVLDKLKSVRLIRDFAKEESKNKNKLFIVLRASKHWGINKNSKHNNIIQFSSGQSRGAHLNKKCIDRIIDFLF